jgi:outer membrane protein OmpA-like peptidoglycan-associated protein
MPGREKRSLRRTCDAPRARAHTVSQALSARPMLDMPTMKTKMLASLIGSTFWLCAGAIASANPAPSGPDFVAARPVTAVDPHLAASDGKTPIDPLDDVAFQFGRAELLSSTLDQLDRAAGWFRAHPGLRVVIEGHTDHVGSTQYNEDLATRRAEAVRHYLMGRGVPSDRMVLVIYGEANPDDRRAVVYASNRPVGEIVAKSIDYGHAELAVWTNKGTLLREQRTPNAPREVIATRR